MRVTKKALQLPIFSFFFFAAKLNKLTEVACRIFPFVRLDEFGSIWTHWKNLI